MVMMMSKLIKTYSELSTLKTFDERFKYLMLNGNVSDITFGQNRYLNQIFYKSSEWIRTKNRIIFRDTNNGSVCDLGIEPISDGEIVIVHHINPITYDDIINRASCLFNPENLICTRLITHNGIHYGNLNSVPPKMIERKPNDMCPWKRGE